MYAMTTACTKVLWNALVTSGVNLHDLPSSIAGIQADLAAGNRIKSTTVYGLFSEVERLTGNPDVGLLAYHYAHPSICNPFMYCILSAPNLGVALDRMVQYHSLISPGTHLFVERGAANTLRLCGLELGNASAPRAFLDAGAALILGLLRWLVPDHRIAPLRVEFTYPQPASTDKLVRCFGPQLTFGASANTLVFCDSIRDLVLPSSNEALDLLHVEHADTLVQEILKGSMASKVRRQLMEYWSTQGQASMADVAQRLGVSSRALQKSLGREGSSFKEIADECRLTLAYSYLRNSTRSLKYIASTLGYTDQSSFHKACLRWFGMPPDRFRRTAD
jgi:AraC-like DNA-binding protein